MFKTDSSFQKICSLGMAKIWNSDFAETGENGKGSPKWGSES